LEEEIEEKEWREGEKENERKAKMWTSILP
jgi:hypothetical protein